MPPAINQTTEAANAKVGAGSISRWLQVGAPRTGYHAAHTATSATEPRDPGSPPRLLSLPRFWGRRSGYLLLRPRLSVLGLRAAPARSSQHARRGGPCRRRLVTG